MVNIKGININKNRLLINKSLILPAYVSTNLSLLFISSLLQTIGQKEWIFYMSLIVVFHFTFSFMTLILLLKINFVSLISFFLILTYFFHFGQIILMGIFPYYKFQQFNVLDVVDFTTFQKSIIYQLLVIMMVVVGIIISVKPTKIMNSFSLNNISQIVLYNKSAVFTGRIILLLCFPIRLKSDILKIQATMSGDYFDAFNTGESGMLSMLGYFTFVGVAVLLIEYSKINKKKATVITLITLLYLCITMLSGGRGQQLTILLMIVYIYFKCIRQLKLKNILILTILGWLLIILLNTIFLIRLDGFPTFDELIIAFKKSMESDPILKIIEELGATQYTVCLTMEQINNIKEAALGKTYLSSVPLIFINVGGILEQFIYSSHYVKSLDGSYLGGSYIGELFFNFRYMGIFFATFIGIFMNIVSQKIETYSYKRQSIKFAYFIPLFTYTLWWVRDAFGGWLRPSLWGGIIIFCVYSFFKVYRINHTRKSNEGYKIKFKL